MTAFQVLMIMRSVYRHHVTGLLCLDMHYPRNITQVSALNFWIQNLKIQAGEGLLISSRT